MKKYLNILIATLLVAIGIGCYLGQAHVNSNTSPGWYTALGNIGSAILICGLLTFLQDLITKQIEDANLRSLLGISSSIRESRLKTILTDSSQFNYKDLIIKSADFSAILNDGLRWVGNNSPHLEKRFSRKNTVTEFFFVDPESHFSHALAQKTDKTHDELKSKIEQSVSQLVSTYNKTCKAGELRIYYLKNYPTQTLFYADDSVVVTPYQVSSGRSIIPLYEYEYEEGHVSIASHLFKDLETVRKESRLISVNGEFSSNVTRVISKPKQNEGWRRYLPKWIRRRA